MSAEIRVLVWNEYIHERQNEHIARVYPRGIHFRPGHETHPIYFQPEVLQVIVNAVRWAAPVNGPQVFFGNHQPLEKI